MLKKLFCTTLFLFILFNAPTTFARWIRGIYLTQSTLENSSKLNYLIRQAKSVGINSFVIDINRPSRRYKNNIQKVKRNGIRYVARVVVFPGGGTHAQISSENYWQRKFKLARYAANYGANAIQLDYIRYRSSNRASSQNARNVYRVIRWFKQRVSRLGLSLEIDVFGETAFGESRHIGQNLKLFAPAVNAMCPMVYPSHYEPYRHHATRPYKTVHSSIVALRRQFKNRVPFKIYPFIELYNYRYSHTRAEKLVYIYKQLKAVQDSGANGWYAWSAANQYKSLFNVLRRYQLR